MGPGSCSSAEPRPASSAPAVVMGSPLQPCALVHQFSSISFKKIDNSKSYSRCEMEPLPNEIYQDIVDFQSDVNRPIDISIYRELKEAA